MQSISSLLGLTVIFCAADYEFIGWSHKKSKDFCGGLSKERCGTRLIPGD
jgi:hypothetical protein